MSRFQFVLASILGAICIILAVAVIVAGRSNQSLQAQLQAQQIEITKGTQSQQIGSNLVRDIAVAAAKNQKLKDLLIRNGFTLNETPSPSPAPAR